MRGMRVTQVFALLAVAAIATGLGAGLPPAARAQEKAPAASKDDLALVAQLAEPAKADAAEAALAARGAEAVPALVEGVVNPKSRAASLRLLTKLGPAAKAALPVLAMQVRSPTNPQLAEICVALGEIADATPNSAVTDGLAFVIGSKKDIGRAEAMAALAKILVRQGTPADPASRVTPEVKAALDGLLGWLERHQAQSGFWGSEEQQAACKGATKCTEYGEAANRAGVTGLALLALVRAPEFAQTPARRAAADLAAKALREGQAADGCLGNSLASHCVYSHAVAGQALAEHFRSAQNPASRTAVERAVAYTIGDQNAGSGWRYSRADRDSDTSVTARCAEFLVVARDAGCADAAKVDAALTGALAWVVSMTSGSGRTGYQQTGGGAARTVEMQDRFPNDLVEPLTACGISVRMLAPQTGATTDPWIPKSIALLAAKPPAGDTSAGAVDLYYWVYGAASVRSADPKLWQRWWPRLRASVLANVEKRPGCALGGFAATDPWSHDGGRTYLTAMAALCLETGTPEPQLLTKPSATQAKLIAALRGATTAPGSPAKSAQTAALAAIDLVFAAN